MRKYVVMEWSILRKLFVTGSLIALFYAFYESRMAASYSCRSLECLLVLAYGDVSIEGIKYVIPVLFWIAPQIFLLYILGEYVSHHLGRNAIYIFTRTDRRDRWLLGKSFSLFLYVLFYWTVQFVVLSIIGYWLGYHIANWGQGMLLIISAAVLQVLLNFLIILIINLLSIRMNLLFSVVTVLAANFFCLLCAQVLKGIGERQEQVIKWLPFTQGILSWHSDVRVMGAGHGFFNFHVQGFSVMFSMLYMIILTAVAIFIGIRKIEKMDLL